MRNKILVVYLAALVLIASGCSPAFVKPAPTPIILNDGLKIETTHCRVSNNGFDINYALAWATICEVSYEGYQEIYGLDPLAFNKLQTIEIRLFRENLVKPSLNAHGGKITFHGNVTHMLPPVEGGANNIYGICHEMGHLVFPISDPMYFEAWADYAAAYRIIPYVWERLGADAWPQPYDYLANDGPEDLRRRITEEAGSDISLQNYYRAVSALISIDEKYSPQAFGKAILQSESYVNLDDFEEALVKVTGDQKVRDLFAVQP